jgi:hypothetical protein
VLHDGAPHLRARVTLDGTEQPVSWLLPAVAPPRDALRQLAQEGAVRSSRACILRALASLQPTPAVAVSRNAVTTPASDAHAQQALQPQAAAHTSLRGQPGGVTCADDRMLDAMNLTPSPHPPDGVAAAQRWGACSCCCRGEGARRRAMRASGAAPLLALLLLAAAAATCGGSALGDALDSTAKLHADRRALAAALRLAVGGALPPLLAERSHAHLGTLSWLRRFLGRYAAGEPLTVLALGGSVTVGNKCPKPACLRHPSFNGTWSRRVFDALVAAAPSRAAGG